MAFTQKFNNPYVANENDLELQTPAFDQIIRDALHDERLKINKWLPAKVTKVMGSGKVNIQPLLKRLYKGESDPIDLPEIQNCMVNQPQGADYHIKLPVKVGDLGRVVFCDRSLDIWSSGSGSSVDPQDSRNHDLTDAVFVPGLYPFSEQIEDETTDLVIRNGDAEIRVQASGKFTIANQSQELFDLLDQTLKNMSDLYNALQTQTFTLTALGPQPFIASTIAALAQLQAAADGIKTKLDSMKGEQP